MQIFTPENIKNIPSSPGVYIFHGESMPLYVGKSVNLHNRLLNHLNAKNEKSQRFVEQTKEIEIIPTAGNVGAEIRESRLIKSLSPIFNRMLRRERSLLKVYLKQNEQKYLVPAPSGDVQTFDYNLLAETYIFRSKRDLNQLLDYLSRKKGFCAKILGLEKGKFGTPCFGYQLGRCKGACIGKITSDEYNNQLKIEFGKFYVHKWPFESEVTIEENHLDMEESFTIKNWMISNVKTKNISHSIDLKPTTTVDEYKILARYFLSGEVDDN